MNLIMHRGRKLGMFEKVQNPDTGEVFRVTSGRARYNNIKSSEGSKFPSRSSDAHVLSIQEKMNGQEGR